MKVLIVEDSTRKKKEVIDILATNNLTDIVTEKIVCKVFQRVQQENFDLLITDLGLPRFIDYPVVEDIKEGLKMMYDLSYMEKEIPTIIYSETELSEEEKAYLNEIEYPYLGQAKNKEELKEKITASLVKIQFSKPIQKIK